MATGSVEHDRRAAHATVVDGNALAGSLGRVLGGDATVLVTVCGECGSAAALAEASVEVDDHVAIARCRRCSHTLFSLAHAGPSPSLRLAALCELRVG